MRDFIRYIFLLMVFTQVVVFIEVDKYGLLTPIVEYNTYVFTLVVVELLVGVFRHSFISSKKQLMRYAAILFTILIGGAILSLINIRYMYIVLY